MKTYSFDASIFHSTTFQSRKITEGDLRLIDHYGIKDWNDKEFDREGLIKYSKWLVNEDKSVIFMSRGGGSFEIPEMYDLIYKGEKVQIWCGGSGDSARTFVKHADNSYDATVHVSRVGVPPDLSHERDSVLALVAEAFAVNSFRSVSCRKLTVQF